MSERYSLVCRIWSLVFLGVGLLFLLLPGPVGEGLTALGRLFGLAGSIDAGGRTLWHVLALSLMGTITLLADASARRPSEVGTYHALLAAKLISTAGFLFLALAEGPVWLVCASGDAFVALTLWAARRPTLGSAQPA